MHTENCTEGATERDGRTGGETTAGHAHLINSVWAMTAVVHFTKSQKPLSIPAADRQNNRIASGTTKTYLNIIKYRCARKYYIYVAYEQHYYL